MQLQTISHATHVLKCHNGKDRFCIVYHLIRARWNFEDGAEESYECNKMVFINKEIANP